MSTAFVKIPYTEKVELRQQANYWRFVHGRAVEREAVLKEEAKVMEDTIRGLRKTNGRLRELITERDASIIERDRQIEALKAKLVWLKQQAFGRKTEQSIAEPAAESEQQANPSVALADEFSEEKRNRGQQRGSKGHGRKLRTNLPYVEQ